MSGSAFPAARTLLRRILTAALLVAGLSVMLHAQDTTKRGRKYKMPPATAKVEVTVLRSTNGKPVENAAVIFHPLVDGRDNGNMELKTNEEGKALIDLLPIGSSVRVQIIAEGFQTYGEDYKVDKDTMAIEVKLNRPGKQYSIYKKSEGNEANKNEADKPRPSDPPSADANSTPKADAPPTAPPDPPAAETKPQDATPPK